MIQQYGATISYKRYEIKRKIVQRLERYFLSINLLHESIESVKQDPESFVMKTVDHIHSYTRSKKRLVDSLRKFFTYLNERYSLHINVDLYLPIGRYMTTYERHIEL